jgi:hypothetical protein
MAAISMKYFRKNIPFQIVQQAAAQLSTRYNYYEK